eukprot:CAMPEP_0113894674 /NCGR_PEP_ID=MMETSP0780_2-20120614/16877_1 /TAXON_ID=652834 /ORGANISM="Palpitomonas bilix" /LENGTH=399 /DNA_ID=CAMNT_0000885297 /DNA_START=530 /DNA_END=1729 /DNA_ORIENTATION=- /assembly_acc=CAM_ASM_000599
MQCSTGFEQSRIAASNADRNASSSTAQDESTEATEVTNGSLLQAGQAGALLITDGAPAEVERSGLPRPDEESMHMLEVGDSEAAGEKGKKGDEFFDSLGSLTHCPLLPDVNPNVGMDLSSALSTAFHMKEDEEASALVCSSLPPFPLSLPPSPCGGGEAAGEGSLVSALRSSPFGAEREGAVPSSDVRHSTTSEMEVEEEVQREEEEEREEEGEEEGEEREEERGEEDEDEQEEEEAETMDTMSKTLFEIRNAIINWRGRDIEQFFTQYSSTLITFVRLVLVVRMKLEMDNEDVEGEKLKVPFAEVLDTAKRLLELYGAKHKVDFAGPFSLITKCSTSKWNRWIRANCSPENTPRQNRAQSPRRLPFARPVTRRLNNSRSYGMVIMIDRSGLAEYLAHA